MSARISRKQAKAMGIDVPAPSKYRAQKTPGLWFGELVTFDSGKEAKRAQELQYMQKAGEIRDLRRQVKFDLPQADTYYLADFDYWTRSSHYVVEDVKSPATRRLPAYRMKKALVKHEYGISILET